MGIVKAINERKPVATVSVGSVSIPIYAAPVTLKRALPATDANDAKPDPDPDPESKTYQSFQIAHYEGTRRILQRRNTLESSHHL